MVRVWKTKSLYILFCLRCDPLIVFLKVKSYNFHFHKNDVIWPLSANGLLQPKATKQRIVLKNFGGVPVLKFFHRLALDFPYVCRDVPRDKCIGNLKSGSRSSSVCNVLKLWSFSLQIIFFSEQLFYGNYSKLDSHTNTVISHAFAFCLFVKMASKTVTRSIKGPISLNKIDAENGGGCIVYVARWKLQFTTWLFGDL